MQTMPPLSGGQREMAQAIRELSRLKYGRLREDVEAEILEASQVAEYMAKAGFNTEKTA